MLLVQRGAVLYSVTQSCPTLCNPRNYSPPCSSVHGDSPGINTGVGCCSLLQGIFPTQESNWGLLHCRWILYRLSHQEGQEYWSGLPCLLPRGLANLGIKPGSPTSQAGLLPAEVPGARLHKIIRGHSHY